LDAVAVLTRRLSVCGIFAVIQPQLFSQILLGLRKEARVALLLGSGSVFELFGFRHCLIKGFSRFPTRQGHI
jgi:hypothetical protein